MYAIITKIASRAADTAISHPSKLKHVRYEQRQQVEPKFYHPYYQIQLVLDRQRLHQFLRDLFH